jgi:hypothetical protein
VAQAKTNGDRNNPARRCIGQPALVLAAADSLGRFGPAAKESIPSLKGLLEPGRVNHNDLQNAGMETEKRWQSRIQAIINKIEAK